MARDDTAPGDIATAARHMDSIYAGQRHIYDLTRKYYLLGRDRLIAELDVPFSGNVLELGCGTARNLIAVARAYPHARCHGIDVSNAMLATAAASVARAGLADRITLAHGDATATDAATSFGVAGFDRVLMSYTLSMIPDWQAVIDCGIGALSPRGELHIVDFGQQAQLPAAFRVALRHWLARFDVSPRAALLDTAADRATRHGLTLRTERLYRDYAWRAVLARPDTPASRLGKGRAAA